MGEVYRARYTKLRRSVAIKVLPKAFADDADRLHRFESEAQALASFNHPHIGAIYGFEEVQGERVLFLEMIEGTRRVAAMPIVPRMMMRLVAVQAGAVHDPAQSVENSDL